MIVVILLLTVLFALYFAIYSEIWYDCVLVLIEEMDLGGVYSMGLSCQETTSPFKMKLGLPRMKDVTNENYYEDLNQYFDEALRNANTFHPFWKKFIK